MKKTILATAILLAGTANAAEVYSNDGTTISLGGSFRGHVEITDGADKKVTFKDAGSRFDIKAAKELDNGLKAFGSMEIKYNSDDGNVKDTLYLNHAYAGFAHDVYGTATLGKQLGLNDDAFTYDFSYEHGNIYNQDNDTLGSDTEDQLKYVKAFGNASVVVSLMDEKTYAVGGTYDVAGLSLIASYNVKNDVDFSGGTVDNSTYVVGASYAIDALTLAATYTATDVNNEDSSSYGIGAHYQLGQVGLYTMYDSTSHDNKSEEYDEFVIGADYEIAKDVIVYAEFGAEIPESGSNINTLYLGSRLYF